MVKDAVDHYALLFAKIFLLLSRNMSYQNFCDICGKKIEKDYDKPTWVDVSLRWPGKSLDVCIKCWGDKKKWARIQAFETSNTSVK